MEYEEIVRVLTWAGGQLQPVRITTTSETEVTGIPTTVDTHVTAHEVYLRVPGEDDVEIAISLGAIDRVELL
jgi:hypothetical protein